MKGGNMNLLNYLESFNKLENFDIRRTNEFIINLALLFSNKVDKALTTDVLKNSDKLDFQLGKAIFGNDYQKISSDYLTKGEIGIGLRDLNLETIFVRIVNDVLNTEFKKHGLNGIHRDTIDRLFLESTMDILQKDPRFNNIDLSTIGISKEILENLVNMILNNKYIEKANSSENFVARLEIAFRFDELNDSLNNYLDLEDNACFKNLTKNEKSMVRLILNIEKSTPGIINLFIDELSKQAIKENPNDLLKIMDIFNDIKKNNKIGISALTKTIKLLPENHIKQILDDVKIPSSPILNVFKNVLLKSPIKPSQSYTSAFALNSILRSAYGTNIPMGILTNILNIDAKNELSNILSLLRNTDSKTLSHKERGDYRYLMRKFASSKKLLSNSLNEAIDFISSNELNHYEKLTSVKVELKNLLQNEQKDDTKLFTNWGKFETITYELGDILNSSKANRMHAHNLRKLEQIMSKRLLLNQNIINTLYKSDIFRKCVKFGFIKVRFLEKARELENNKNMLEKYIKVPEPAKVPDPTKDHVESLDDYVESMDIKDLFKVMNIDSDKLPVFKQFENLPLELFGISNDHVDIVERFFNQFQKRANDIYVYNEENLNKIDSASKLDKSDKPNSILINFIESIPQNKRFFNDLEKLNDEFHNKKNIQIKSYNDVFYADLFNKPENVFKHLEAFENFDKTEQENIIDMFKFLGNSLNIIKTTLIICDKQLKTHRAVKDKDTSQLRSTLETFINIIDSINSYQIDKRVCINKPFSSILIKQTINLPPKTREEILDTLKNALQLKGIAALAISSLKNESFIKGLYYSNFLDVIANKKKIMHPLILDNLQNMSKLIENNTNGSTAESYAFDKKEYINSKKGNHYFVDALILADITDADTYKKMGVVLNNAIDISLKEIASIKKVDENTLTLWKYLKNNTTSSPYISDSLALFGFDTMLDKVVLDKDLKDRIIYKIVSEKENYEIFSKIAVKIGSKSLSFLSISSYRDLLSTKLSLDKPSSSDLESFNSKRMEKYKTLGLVKNEIESYLKEDGAYSLKQLVKLIHNKDEFLKNIPSANNLSSNNEDFYNIVLVQSSKILSKMLEKYPNLTKEGVINTLNIMGEYCDKQQYPSYFTDYVSKQIQAPNFKNFSDFLVRDIILWPIEKTIECGVKDIKKSKERIPLRLN